MSVMANPSIASTADSGSRDNSVTAMPEMANATNTTKSRDKKIAAISTGRIAVTTNPIS